jgi:hypothetical protein
MMWSAVVDAAFLKERIMDSIEHRHHVSVQRRRGNWVFLGFAAIALFFLWTEHRAHLLGVLPYLLVLACPLMHLFHHGHGHGHHGDTEQSAASAEPSGEQKGERDAR